MQYADNNGHWTDYEPSLETRLLAALDAGLMTYEMTCDYGAGPVTYVLDFIANCQYRKNDPSRKRAIRMVHQITRKDPTEETSFAQENSINEVAAPTDKTSTSL